MIDLSQEEILAIYLSLKIAFAASLVSLPLAILLGYLFARKEFLFKSFLLVFKLTTSFTSSCYRIYITYCFWN